MRAILLMVLIGLFIYVKQHPAVLVSHDALVAYPATIISGYAYSAYQRTVRSWQRRLRLAR